MSNVTGYFWKSPKIFLLLASGAFGLFFTLLESPLEIEAQTGPNDAAAVVSLNNRGVALMDQFKFQESIQVFRRILESNPEVAAAWVNLGISYFYNQQYAEAESAFQEALERNSGNPHAHYMLGLIYRNRDEIERSIRSFQAVLKEDSQNPSTNYYLGLLATRQRNYQQARQYFDRVIEREPYNASAHYNLATALLRSGNREEGQREMEEFRRLQNLFGSTTVGLQYLEQGRYAMAIEEIPERDLPGVSRLLQAEPNPVVFTETASQAGLRFRHSGPGKPPSQSVTATQLRDSMVPWLGSGAAFVDFDQDGRIDLFLADAGGQSAGGILYRNTGDGTFQDHTPDSRLELNGNVMQGIWGDYDNDGFPDLYLIREGSNQLWKNQGDGTFQDVTEPSATGDPGWGLTGAFVDFDHDGDLDIYVGNFVDLEAVPREQTGSFPRAYRGASNVLYRNNGDGTFSDVSEHSSLAGGMNKTTAVIASDLDNSRDVDFYVVNYLSPNQLFQNLRDGTFREAARTAALAGAGTGTGVAAGDFDGDTLVDLALPSLQPGKGVILHNGGNQPFTTASILNEGMPASQAIAPATQFFDYDNDGDLDLLVVQAPLFEGELQPADRRSFFLLRNDQKSWTDVSRETGLAEYKNLPVRGVSIADPDSDGDLDFVVNVNGGSPLLFRNDGGNRHNWVSVKLKGTNSNHSGVGAKVEVKADSLRQKQELYSGHGFLGNSSPLLHFGLGSRKKVDVVRILWPNGVLQSELDQPSNQLVEVVELDRKGTSCPILYTWNGRSYQFQTDFLGGAAYGYLLGSGEYNYPDTDEYVKLNRQDVALKDGRVAISMNNQLEEVIFFDVLELLVVDHPADYEIYPDEKLLPGPPYQPFRLITAKSARPPVSAVDGRGRSVLPQISSIDREYPDHFQFLPYKGYAEEHELILDLGEVSPDHVTLLLHAWIDYADSTSNLAASQAGVKLIAPYLQMQDAQGNWVTVVERMGFPAGLPKTMTVDLSGLFPADSRKVRIVTNMRIFWDQILVDSSPPRQDFQLYRLPAERAELRFFGFPAFVSPDGRQPAVYDFDRVLPAAPWKAHVGGYTRFGDVLPLLSEVDDRYVVTRSGDQIEAFFDVSGLPRPAAGWERDYLVYVDGFGKDMDPNSAAPHFVGPLPFHGMSAFPYPEGERYPDSPAHRKYLETWNTRTVEDPLPLLDSRYDSEAFREGSGIITRARNPRRP